MSSLFDFVAGFYSSVKIRCITHGSRTSNRVQSFHFRKRYLGDSQGSHTYFIALNFASLLHTLVSFRLVAASHPRLREWRGVSNFLHVLEYMAISSHSQSTCAWVRCYLCTVANARHSSRKKRRFAPRSCAACSTLLGVSCSLDASSEKRTYYGTVLHTPGSNGDHQKSTSKIR